MHPSPTVTLGVYAHLMRQMNQESAGRLQDSLSATDQDEHHKGEAAGESGSNQHPRVPAVSAHFCLTHRQCASRNVRYQIHRSVTIRWWCRRGKAFRYVTKTS